MSHELSRDHTTMDEALGDVEAAEMMDPRVGDGTPQTAPHEPVPQTLADKVRATLRRDP
jgi:hypothetical protein